MEVGLGIGPVPLCDDYIPFDSLWSWRCLWDFAFGNPIGPVGEHRAYLLASGFMNGGDHITAGLPRHQTTFPRFNGRVEFSQRGRKFACAFAAQLMACQASS